MKQVVQSRSGGSVRVVEVPCPTIGPAEVLVRTSVSGISTGTERALARLAQGSLLDKARARPDLVRQVVRRARTDGIVKTARAARSRLDEDMPLGYSGAGVVVEVGEAVSHISVGDRVATGGAGKANHAEYQAVPALLCAPLPDGVTASSAAFAAIASIALHALRLADVEPGGRIVVIGLGLVGQLAVRLAGAAGCGVAGIDVAASQVAVARRAGALGLVEAGNDTNDAVRSWSRGRGGDAVIVTAGGRSSSVMKRVPDLCRDRAKVVVVGDVPLDLDRRAFYDRELSLQVSRSYGPGRYDRSYEEWAVDYPVGHVRWTEGRNMEAFLDLLAARRLEVADLVTHVFPIEAAAAAYSLLEESGEFLGIQLRYDSSRLEPRAIRRRPARMSIRPGVGLVGAGAFARDTLLPAFREGGFDRFVAVASASGLSAGHLADRAGFEKAVSGPSAVIDDPEVDVVVVATTHEAHAQIVERALAAGKHVFCEKPLALTMEELDAVEKAWRSSRAVLFVGFNRRWSTPVARVRAHFEPGTGPLAITYRVNAGRVGADHWYRDRRQGGRLLGEACHFIDLCSAIVGMPADTVTAVASEIEAPLVDEDFFVGIRYADGSLASILYAVGGPPGVPKEHFEVFGRGRAATVTDFRDVSLDGRRVPRLGQDKGFVREVEAFRSAIEDGVDPGDWPVTSMRTTLQAAISLLQGGRPQPG